MHTTFPGERQPTVLLVEDDPMIADMMADVLRAAGFDVLAVSAAEDALGVAVMDVAIDALVTDINLAGPLDGWDLAEALREMQPALPVVYASATASGESLSRGVADSVFVPKPYSPYTISALVERFLGKRPPAAAAREAPQPATALEAQVIRLSA